MKEAIRQAARELGFDDCRFTSADAPASSRHFEDWIADERHGAMGYLARNAFKRVDPQQVLPGARSVITLAVSYAPGESPTGTGQTGVVARYARHLDYHDVIGERLKQLTGELDRIVAELPPAATLDGFGPASSPDQRRLSGYGVPASAGPKSEGPRIDPATETREPASPSPRAEGETSCGMESRSPIKEDMLTPHQHRALWYIDTGPVLERDLAQRSGIGFVGKHTNVISRRLGNWIFLAEILTTAELEPDAPEPNKCGTCTRCIRACPTEAITGPFQLDARRCISYLTIELKGSIPEDLRPAIGNRIFGCDDCLAACPWNRFAREGNLMKAHRRPDLAAPDLLELLAIDAPTFKQRYRGTPFERAKRRGLLRNVCVALGNVGDATVLPALERATRDPEPLIAEHAHWALRRVEEKTTK